jgi:hypothetical protein
MIQSVIENTDFTQAFFTYKMSTVSEYTSKCNIIYAYKKYGLLSADFHETPPPKRSAALRVLYLSPNFTQV